MSDDGFRSYHDMENIQKNAWLKAIQEHECVKQIWIMLEKIHGANFQFWTDGVTVRVGKRTSFIGEPYDVKFFDRSSSKDTTKTCDPRAGFFRADHIAALYSDNVKALHFELFGDCHEAQRPIVIVYGEIFGGFYNNEIKKPWQRVQVEVQYHPENKFMAFDIVTVDQKREHFKTQYTNYDKCVELFERHKIPYVPVLFRGTFDEVYAKSQSTNADKTTIPTLLGLEDMKEPNIREGHVLKPVEPAYIGRDIVYIKDKNDKFTEVCKFKKSKPQSSETSYDIQEFLEAAPNYITSQRFANVISKFGPVSLDGDIEKKILNELNILFLTDALKDLQKDLGHELSGGDLKEVRKSITLKAFETAGRYCNWKPSS